MNDCEILINHIDKVHTTEMGVDRIKRNLRLQVDDVVSWCKYKIQDKNSHIYKQGKNWYIEIDGCRITVNAHSYTIITAHLMKKISSQ